MSTPVLLFVAAIAVLGTLAWLKMAPKLRAALALYVGANIGAGWVAGWLATAVSWIAEMVGKFGAYLTGVPAAGIAAAIPAVIGLVALIVFAAQMWPKKGKAGGMTAVAGFVVPLMWSAMVDGLNQVSPALTGGGA